MTVFFALLGSPCIKAVPKMLLKLTAGDNFIKFLLMCFFREDPKSAKRQSSCQSFFALLGSAHTKASLKLTPGVCKFFRLQAFLNTF